MSGPPAEAGGNKKEQFPLLACSLVGRGLGVNLFPMWGEDRGVSRGLAGAVALRTTPVVLSAEGVFSTLFLLPTNYLHCFLKIVDSSFKCDCWLELVISFLFFFLIIP